MEPVFRPRRGVEHEALVEPQTPNVHKVRKVEPAALVHKVRKVYKVRKVRGPLRGALSTAAGAADSPV